MRIFQEVSPVDTEGALVSATRAIVKEAIVLPKPWSLCEIQPDEEDYQWLRDWASQLSPRQLQRWLGGINSRRIALQESGINLSYRESAGCLLLLLASESARRRASEGYVWPTVHSQLTEQVGSILFVQGQPRSIFKDAIEASARKLGLRHVFGVEGTQNYYLSVYLQFGFTRKGMARLAHWLAGQPSTQTVMYSWGTMAREWEASPLSGCGMLYETTVGTISLNRELARRLPTVPGSCRIGPMNCSTNPVATLKWALRNRDRQGEGSCFLRNSLKCHDCGGIGLQRRHSRAMSSTSLTSTSPERGTMSRLARQR